MVHKPINTEDECLSEELASLVRPALGMMIIASHSIVDMNRPDSVKRPIGK